MSLDYHPRVMKTHELYDRVMQVLVNCILVVN